MGIRVVNSAIEKLLDMRLADYLPLLQLRIARNTRYFGVHTQKNPLDFWVYQEIIYEMHPDFIVEIGNNKGGSTLALAHLLDCSNHGRVIGVDIDQGGILDKVRDHPRITLIEGDAIECYDEVAAHTGSEDNVLVIEDSSHRFDNTLAVLRTYSNLIKPGGYFIVEDGICHHGLDIGPSPGPYEAVEAYIKENPDFEIDRDRESFLITWNPKGFLRRNSSG